jgi:heavy metal translocating P-type ATPase
VNVVAEAAGGGPTAQEQPGCAYCGLPITAAAGDAAPRYCCFGCRFAADVAGSGGEDGQLRWLMTRLGLAVFFTMNVMVFTLALWSQQETAPGGPVDPAAAAFHGLARHACLLFTAPVLLLLGGPLLEDAWDELRRGRASLNMLLVVGVAAAFLQSAWATWSGSGHVYFEVACMVLVAVTLGRWLEATGKLRTTAALRDLRKLLPDRVRRLAAADDRASEREIDRAEVAAGDLLRILPGEHLPADGTIVSGEAAIDERTVTGESVPAVKRAGDAVYGGTCDLDGELVVRVKAAAGAGTLERLIDAVTRAANGGRQQRLAEVVSNWFLPVVLLVAAGACAAHWRTSGPVAGVLAGLAVVVVSCPCALGLATPLAVWAAFGSATRRHVLIRDGDAFARLARADLFCFDKTGTLTAGCRVTETIAPPGGASDDAPDNEPEDWLPVAAALAQGSTHVFSVAISAHAAAAQIQPVPIAGLRAVAGSGVEGVLADGRVARLGSGRWIARHVATGWPEHDPDPPQCFVAADSRLLGGIRFAESIRAGAQAAVESLESAGGRPLMLSGDRADRAAAVAEALGIAWQAPLFPEEKLAAIEAGKREGRTVVMVGDGVNDAPALAAADVGVALGCGADVSRWTADICLLRDDLAALPWLTDLARRMNRTVRWNLLWAFGYNAACIPLAAMGLVHPALAAAAMVASSLFVITNSLRLGGVEGAA